MRPRTASPRRGVPFSRSVEALGDDPEMPLYRAAADWTQRLRHEGGGRERTDPQGRPSIPRDHAVVVGRAVPSPQHRGGAARAFPRNRRSGCIERFDGRGGSHATAWPSTRRSWSSVSARSGTSVSRGTRPRAEARPGARSALTLGLLEASKMVATAAKGAGGSDDRLTPESRWCSCRMPRSGKPEHRSDGTRGELRALLRRAARRVEATRPSARDPRRRTAEHVPDPDRGREVERAALSHPEGRALRPHQPLRDPEGGGGRAEGVRKSTLHPQPVPERAVAQGGVLSSRRRVRRPLPRGSRPDPAPSGPLGGAVPPRIRRRVSRAGPSPRVPVRGEFRSRTSGDRIGANARV